MKFVLALLVSMSQAHRLKFVDGLEDNELDTLPIPDYAYKSYAERQLESLAQAEAKMDPDYIPRMIQPIDPEVHKRN